jgi:Cu/Ag efflux protein CusF
MEHQAGYLNVGDLIYYGKFKNALARILSFGTNEKGDPTVEAQPVNKDGTDKKGQPKTLVLMKVRKVQAMTIADRVAARFMDKVARGLDLGKTWENGKVRVHRYANSFHVWDLANAGKRGKKVRMMIVTPNTYSRSAEEEWLERHARRLVLQAARGYDGIKSYFEQLDDEVEADISERQERGIDILPGDTKKIELRWKVGDNELDMTADTLKFSVKSSVPLSHAKTGEPVGRQDTLYWSAKKADATRFYSWLSGEGESKVQRLNITALRQLWKDLGVRYDYH